MNVGGGKTYEVSGNTTEWEDILISKGITTKENVLLGKGLNPADFEEKNDEEAEAAAAAASEREPLENANLDQLDELGEDDEFADDNFLEQYRQARIDQLRQDQVKNRFGDVREITKDQWVHEVTDTSKTGCVVVVHLYQDSVVECGLVDEAMAVLAPKFRYVKFVRIRSTSAVENWPDANLPTLFVYRAGELAVQMLTLKSLYGKGMKAHDLEWWLVGHGIVTTSELDHNPRDKDY